MCAVDTPPGKNISIHALREEGDPASVAFAVAVSLFLSTPSARRATRLFDGLSEPFDISIHALREEGDPPVLGVRLSSSLFLSTPSARRATTGGAGRKPSKNISIHALREEGDTAYQRQESSHTNFYPRPPRGGRPAKTAEAAEAKEYFYPRPPRGGRHRRNLQRWSKHLISIHALREEGDRFKRRQDVKLTLFLSTPSARRATQYSGTRRPSLNRFLSTPSARRATYNPIKERG